VWPPGSADTVRPRPPLTLTFDRLTLKLVCESYLRWGTFLPNLGTLSLWVLEIFATYATDEQTDGRTDKSNTYCPLPCDREHNNNNWCQLSTANLAIARKNQYLHFLAVIWISTQLDKKINGRQSSRNYHDDDRLNRFFVISGFLF